MDVLSHLTCPLRYVVGKYGHHFDVTEYKKPITEILDAVISREKALEVNTSGVKTAFRSTMPDGEILRWYRNMGGRLITLGSDSHAAVNLSAGFDEARQMLLDLGYKSYFYYEKRRPVEVPLD